MEIELQKIELLKKIKLENLYKYKPVMLSKSNAFIFITNLSKKIISLYDIYILNESDILNLENISDIKIKELLLFLNQLKNLKYEEILDLYNTITIDEKLDKIADKILSENEYAFEVLGNGEI